MNWSSVRCLWIGSMLVAVVAAMASPSQAECADGSSARTPGTREEQLFSAIEAGDATRVNEQLAARPELIRARCKGVSVVMAALFVRRKGFLFTPPDENPVLAAVLARRPTLDLFEASATGNLERMRHLLAKHPARARGWDPRGWSALHLAAFGGSAGAAELLLQHGADIHARTKTRFRLTPLLTALLNGQYPTSKLLLERGADVRDQQVNGGTALHEAAFICRRDLVVLLLAHGAELNARSHERRTPLSEARRGQCEELAAWLAARGALDADP